MLRHTIAKISLLISFVLILTEASAQTRVSVYFDFDKSILKEDDKKELDKAIKNPVEKVSVIAHCDSVDSDEYNDALSMRRAKAVKDYLMNKGIDGRIISNAGKGKREPLNDNGDDAKRALNRRADVNIVYKPIDDEINKPAAIEVKKDTVEFKKDTIARTGIEPIEMDTAYKDSSKYDIQKMEVGSSFRLENLNFVGGRHKLMPRSEPTLEQLLNTMKAFPKLKIRIEGHICCMFGNVDGHDYDSGDEHLSYNRAKAIYEYLNKKGIPGNRMSYRGFGANRKLIYYEQNEADRETNRRVEIRIIEK